MEEQAAYQIRLSSRAANQIDQEHERLAISVSLEYARRWQDDLMRCLASLATFPKRCVIAPENALFGGGELRQYLFRRKAKQPAWRILFSIEDQSASDPPTVLIQRIRHLSKRPLTIWLDEDDV